MPIVPMSPRRSAAARLATKKTTAPPGCGTDQSDDHVTKHSLHQCSSAALHPPNAGELPQLLREPKSEQNRNLALLVLILLEEYMSGKPRRAKSSDIKSSDMQRRDEANLGQKETRLEKKKASELSSMSEKSRKSEKKQTDEDH